MKTHTRASKYAHGSCTEKRSTGKGAREAYEARLLNEWSVKRPRSSNLLLSEGSGGRVVYVSGLENRRGLRLTEGSNPSCSA